MPDQSLVTAIYGQLMHRMWSTATTEFKFTLTKIIVHLAAPDAVTLDGQIALAAMVLIYMH